MAEPLSVKDRDFLAAVVMQLREAGAGEVSPDSLLDTPRVVEPALGTMYDISTACNLTGAELAMARDAELAHMIARQDNENVPAGPAAIKCAICMEMIDTIDRFLSPECRHSFCKTCIRRHLEIVATETHQYPLTCPQCQATGARHPVELNSQACLAIMVGTGAAHRSLERLLLERQHLERMRYCANPTCSMPFDWVDDPGLQGDSRRFMVTCPSCNKDSCVQCKLQWHDGRTCEQFAAEKDGRSAVAKLARTKKWKACPKCKAMIGRNGGCNTMTCRCGCQFCYRCGEVNCRCG